jgi:hypothetical protein
MPIYLSLLNYIDGLATFHGLAYEKIEEVNPLMKYIYEIDPYFFLTIKIALSILLILLFNMAKQFNNFIIRNGLIFASITYTFICLKHTYWILLVFQ